MSMIECRRKRPLLLPYVIIFFITKWIEIKRRKWIENNGIMFLAPLAAWSARILFGIFGWSDIQLKVTLRWGCF